MMAFNAEFIRDEIVRIIKVAISFLAIGLTLILIYGTEARLGISLIIVGGFCLFAQLISLFMYFMWRRKGLA